MTKSKIFLCAMLLATAPMLTACGTSCDCPKCPNTTVVTPQGSDTTVVKPGY